MFKKNDLVELENGSRLYVVSVDDEGLTNLSLMPDGNIVARIPLGDLTLVKPSKFVWLMLNEGKFSDSWEVDGTKLTVPKRLIADIEKYPQLFANSKPKLIEFRCHNDESFEFIHHMKLR